MDEEQRLNLEDIVDERTEAEASILMLRAAVRLLPYLHPDFPDYLKLGLDEWRITKRQEPFMLSILRALQLSYVLFDQPESV
ncbi:hypothetical protein [Cypionkella sp. TWP1-2-1b2]|uniref:hypothetical protein n=1 Tax=Cypionkella sp. TWP1-2-1b2 TaxID=2804675 RepID=UPI003CFAE4B7